MHVYLELYIKPLQENQLQLWCKQIHAVTDEKDHLVGQI